MPGKRSTENGDFVTQRSIYRRDLAAVDALGPLTEMDILDTRGAGYGGQISSSDVNMYGRNAQLDLAIITGVGVTLQVWMRANETVESTSAAPSGSSSSSSSGSGGLILPAATGEWVFVEEKAFTRSELWIIKDVPPAEFKVVVSAYGGTTEPVHILEQHAA